jgi:hypothetical protein
MASYIIIPSLICLRALYDVLDLRKISSNESEKKILNGVLDRLKICGALKNPHENVERFTEEVAYTARGFAEAMGEDMSFSEWIVTLQAEVFQSIIEEELEDLKVLLATQQGGDALAFALTSPGDRYTLCRYPEDIVSLGATAREHWSADGDPPAEDMFPELSGLNRRSRTSSRMSWSLTRRSTDVSTSSGSTG